MPSLRVAEAVELRNEEYPIIIMTSRRLRLKTASWSHGARRQQLNEWRTLPFTEMTPYGLYALLPFGGFTSHTLLRIG